MATINQIDQELGDLTTFEDLTRVYSEVALTRMFKVRQAVLANREFLKELEEVFVQVQSEYLRRLSESAAKGKPAFKGRVSVLQHNGVAVKVLVAAQTRLYGDILKRTFDAFAESMVKDQATPSGGQAEATIIGRAGLAMYKEEWPGRPMTYFDFPDEKLDRQILGKIIEHLVQYEKVTVFYPKFKNVLVQEPAETELAANRQSQATVGLTLERYHFEPSLVAVMAFFEREIFATFFEQTMRESQLAKFASRALAMDRAQQAIGDRVVKTGRARRLMIKELNNRRQLNLMPAWLNLETETGEAVYE